MSQIHVSKRLVIGKKFVYFCCELLYANCTHVRILIHNHLSPQPPPEPRVSQGPGSGPGPGPG
jgi:hypothetical protein